MAKLNVAVLFGGRAPEHEISIISGIQVLNSLNRNKYNVLPVYISKKGEWLLGDESFYKVDTFKNPDSGKKIGTPVSIEPFPGHPYLEGIKDKFSLVPPKKIKIDVFFPVFHGRFGEDGAFQGLFDLVNVPYVGGDVTSSSVGIDKLISKKISEGLGIATPKANWGNKSAWDKNPKKIISQLMKGINFPVYVKPVRLGSSIGIAKVVNHKDLTEAVEVAFYYDNRVLVEESIENAKEINVSLLGRNPYQFSVCEQPVSSGEILSFSDKYLSGSGESQGMASLKRIVPAKIRPDTERRIRNYAEKFFAFIGGEGVVRIDFLVTKDEKKIYFGEANTIPGSLAFYLWKGKNISFTKLLDRLIREALDRQEEREGLINVFESNVLEGFNGAKASKLQ